MSARPFRVVDLFAGAGGSGTAAKRAADAIGVELQLTAINHWKTAIHSHEINHPWAKHLCASVQGMRWGKTVPGDIDLLIAGPECINHSMAKGGRPLDDESRSSAWAVVEAAEAKRPKYILVENVPRFLKWGPLGLNLRPMKSREGELFNLWFRALETLGYSLEYRVLNSADYGGAQTRERVFILGRLDGARRRGPLPWPVQSHAPADIAAGMGRVLPWRPARDIIDFSIKGQSIFDRERPLVENTMRRIATGARKFWGVDLPFLVVLRRNADARSLDLPLPTVTAAGNHFMLIEPFILGQQTGSVPRPVRLPLPTIPGKGALSVIEPFVISYYGTDNVRSVRDPLPTVTTRDRFGLIQAAHLDVTHRMLAEHELAAAQGFPAGYKFVGTSTEVKAQIGNAWEINKGTALCAAILADHYGIRERAA